MYFKWVHSTKNLLDNAGFNGIWNSHDIINKTWLTKAFKQKMCDIFVSDWYQKVDNNSNYRLFKHTFEFETYLTKLPRLTVNQQKSKVLIFSKWKFPNYSFELNNSTLEIVKIYKYLGILFSKNNSFLATKSK